MQIIRTAAVSESATRNWASIIIDSYTPEDEAMKTE
jgi:hypothetical protein